MFELDIEMLKEQGLQLVDSAKKTAQDLADKGKNKLDLLNQQARLSKAQRQLGALVYSLHKAGEENPALVEKYIDAVAEVEKAIEEIKANMTDDERAALEDAVTTPDRRLLTPPRKPPSRSRRRKSRRSPSSCAARPRPAPSARPRSTATPCSATTVVLSCKIRQNETFAGETLPTLDKSCDMCKMKRIAFLPKWRGL